VAGGIGVMYFSASPSSSLRRLYHHCGVRQRRYLYWRLADTPLQCGGVAKSLPSKRRHGWRNGELCLEGKMAARRKA